MFPLNLGNSHTGSSNRAAQLNLISSSEQGMGGASVVGGKVPSSSSAPERARLSAVAASPAGLSGIRFPRIQHQHQHQLMSAANEGNFDQLLQAGVPSRNLLNRDHLFPYILHGLLDDVEKANGSHIVSWSTDGTAFRVHNPDAFVTQIVPTYFHRVTSFRDFLYKLNRWGFTQDENELCRHPYFVRSSPALCVYIAWIEPLRQVHESVVVDQIQSNVVHIEDDNEEDEGSSLEEFPDDYPVSLLGGDSSNRRTKGPGSFLVRLRALLKRVQEEGLVHIVSWQPHGKSFKVHDRNAFCKLLLNSCMDSEQYGAFQRVLRRWGFHRMKKGRDNGAHYHRHFVRDDPSLCQDFGPQQMRDAMPEDMEEPNFCESGAVYIEEHQAMQLSQLSVQRKRARRDKKDEDEDLKQATKMPKAGPRQVGERLRVPIDALGSVFLVNQLHDEVHVPGLFFPWQLHQMLDEAAEDKDVRENVISWQSDNASFLIHDKEQFLSKVLSKHLPGITWDEFTRKLSGWGFVRFSTSGPQKGAFIHRLFVRGKRGLCKQMRINGKTVSDLFKNQGEFLVRLHGLLEFLEKENKQSIVAWTEDGKAFTILDAKTFINDIFPMYFEPLIWSSFEQKLRAWGFIRIPTGYSNDAPTYSHPGFARDRTPTFVRASERMKAESIRPEHSFLIRLRVMLDDAHRHGYHIFVSWLPHGKAFAVHERPYFANTIMPLYFKAKFASFRLSLRNHGFTQMGGSGWDEGVYYHRLFVRDDPCLCQGLSQKQMKEAMPEWIPPSEEPDFYSSATDAGNETFGITEVVPLSKPCLPKPLRDGETRPDLPIEPSKEDEDEEEGVIFSSPKSQSPQQPAQQQSTTPPPAGTPGATTPSKVTAGMFEATSRAENSNNLTTLIERMFQSNAQHAAFGLPTAPRRNSGK